VRRHSIKACADLRDIQYVTQNFSVALSLSADPGWTQANYAQSDPLSGNSIASFLLLTPSGGSSGYSLLGVYKRSSRSPLSVASESTPSSVMLTDHNSESVRCAPLTSR
jgi:hypothetical protein